MTTNSTDFLTFYRANLTQAQDHRIRATDLRQRYHSWALETGALRLGAKDLRRCMERLGHQPFKSSVMFYEGVRLIGAPAAPRPRRQVVKTPAARVAVMISQARRHLEALEALHLELAAR